MSDDVREVADMVASAQGLLLNMGTVSEAGEAAMTTAGEAAADHGVPAVVDPVGAGATPTRSRVAERLVTDLNPAIISGNYGEVAALAGENAEVRGVESVGDHADIAATAVACARETDAVVVASGETDVVATGHRAFEVRSGDPLMGRAVGTGCMLGVTLATFAAVIDDPLEATLVTPNADETAELVGERPDSPAARERAADRFFDWGADAVLFKGGHVDDGSGTVTDVLVTDEESGPAAFEAERLDTGATHGSECTLSSAIAAGLARGLPLSGAVKRGIEFVRAGLREPALVGQNGSVNHLAWSEPET
nr:hydroxyethylthiazole kinase [Halorubrum halophilum]